MYKTFYLRKIFKIHWVCHDKLKPLPSCFQVIMLGYRESKIRDIYRMLTKSYQVWKRLGINHHHANAVAIHIYIYIYIYIYISGVLEIVVKPLNLLHDDVIKWKHFPRYWPFVRGIHWSPVNSPHKANDAELWCFYPRMNKRSSKQSWGWWFEMPSRQLLHHCNGTAMANLCLIIEMWPK